MNFNTDQGMGTIYSPPQCMCFHHVELCFFIFIALLTCFLCVFYRKIHRKNKCSGHTFPIFLFF